MNNDIFKERSPLKGDIGIAIFERNKKSFTFPIHVHDVFELNYVENAKDAVRIVGSTKEKIPSKDLVLICNPALEHAWQNGDATFFDIHEITIQFSPNTIPIQLLEKPDFEPIKRMFQRASSGLVFSQNTIQKVETILKTTSMETDNFMLRIKFWTLLYTLASDMESRQLMVGYQKTTEVDFNMEKLRQFLRNNIAHKIKLNDVSRFLGMSDSTFSRFLKANTGMSFTSFLLDFRLDAILRELNGIEDFTNMLPVKSLIDSYGFASVAYFYKVFKERTDMTPNEYLRKRRQSLILNI